MRNMPRGFPAGTALVGALLLVAAPAIAVDFDFSGTFRKDNDKLFFEFTVGGTSSSTVTVFSSSWLYGNPPPGAGPGGFDPMLGIWTAAGNLISFQDDGHNVGSTVSNGVWYDHGYWDSYYTIELGPGDYVASITQFDNYRNGDTLGAGFRYDDNPDFTWDLGYGGRTQPYFNGIYDASDPRTGRWEFHLLNVAAAEVVQPVPEPGTLLLLGSGLLGLAGLRRKRP